MPRLAAHVYAAHAASVLKLLQDNGDGMTRSEIAEALNVSKATADSVIKKAGLVESGKRGRNILFTSPSGGDAPEATEPELPPEVKAAAAADSPEVKDVDLDELASLDEELVDTRNALKEAAAKVGKLAGEWATQQALVMALQERMTKLAKQRMDACS
jgi:chemotaxis protein histidine kinase CheA